MPLTIGYRATFRRYTKLWFLRVTATSKRSTPSKVLKNEEFSFKSTQNKIVWKAASILAFREEITGLAGHKCDDLKVHGIRSKDTISLEKVILLAVAQLGVDVRKD